MLTLQRSFYFETNLMEKISAGGTVGGKCHLHIFPPDANDLNGLAIELEFASITQLREFATAVSEIAEGWTDSEPESAAPEPERST